MNSKHLIRMALGCSTLLLGCSKVLLLLLTASCSNNEELPAANHSDAPITFASSIGGEESLTRVADQSWTANDAVGVFMTSDDYATTHDANKQHKAATTGTSVELAAVTGDELYYPASGSNVRFIAYYPYNSSITGLSTTYPITLGSQSTTSGFDLLWYKDATDAGKFNKRSVSNPALAFTHQLTKVVFNIKLSAEMSGSNLTAMTTTLKGVPTVASFNLASGAISGQTTKGNVAFAATTTTATYDKTFQAIIIPHAAGTTFTGRTVDFTFVDPTGTTVTLTWDGLLNTKEFVTNTLYTYNFTLTRTAIELENTTINAWTPGSTESVTVN